MVNTHIPPPPFCRVHGLHRLYHTSVHLLPFTSRHDGIIFTLHAASGVPWSRVTEAEQPCTPLGEPSCVGGAVLEPSDRPPPPVLTYSPPFPVFR